MGREENAIREEIHVIDSRHCEQQQIINIHKCIQASARQIFSARENVVYK